MSNVEAFPTFKIIVVGDAGVGKTTFLNFAYDPTYSFNFTHDFQTLGVEVHPLILYKNATPRVRFNVWDCSGSNKGLDEGYWKEAKCAILMFDVGDYNDESIRKYVRKIKRTCGDIPILLVFNQDDENDFEFHGVIQGCFAMVAISCMHKRNLEIPFQLMMARLGV